MKLQLASKLRLVIRDPSLRLGAALVLCALLLILYGAILLPSPLDQDTGAIMRPPTSQGHVLGTDPLGRDILAWIAAGILTSFEVALGAVILSAVFGTLLGLAAGYLRSIDSVAMRLADLQLAVPPLVIFLGVASVIKFNVFSMIVVLAVVGWVPYARMCRTIVQSEKQKAYIDAARLSRCSPLRILVLHLFPQCLGQITVLATLQCGFALLWEAGLSFLGLGLQPPDISLGYQIASGSDYLSAAWWVTTAPGIALVALILGFNSLGDGVNRLVGSNVGILGE